MSYFLSLCILLSFQIVIILFILFYNLFYFCLTIDFTHLIGYPVLFPPSLSITLSHSSSFDRHTILYLPNFMGLVLYVFLCHIQSGASPSGGGGGPAVCFSPRAAGEPPSDTPAPRTECPAESSARFLVG